MALLLSYRLYSSLPATFSAELFIVEIVMAVVTIVAVICELYSRNRKELLEKCLDGCLFRDIGNETWKHP